MQAFRFVGMGTRDTAKTFRITETLPAHLALETKEKKKKKTKQNNPCNFYSSLPYTHMWGKIEYPITSKYLVPPFSERKLKFEEVTYSSCPNSIFQNSKIGYYLKH